MKNNSFYVEIKDNSMIINYQVTDNVLQDVCLIIELARDYAYQSVNVALVDSAFTETDLETSIINNLQKFLMELRKGLCFCSETTTYSYRKRRLLHRSGFL